MFARVHSYMQVTLPPVYGQLLLQPAPAMPPSCRFVWRLQHASHEGMARDGVEDAWTYMGGSQVCWCVCSCCTLQVRIMETIGAVTSLRWIVVACVSVLLREETWRTRRAEPKHTILEVSWYLVSQFIHFNYQYSVKHEKNTSTGRVPFIFTSVCGPCTLSNPPHSSDIDRTPFLFHTSTIFRRRSRSTERARCTSYL